MGRAVDRSASQIGERGAGRAGVSTVGGVVGGSVTGHVAGGPAEGAAALAAELSLRNNRACLLVAAGELADAESELLRCVQLAPGELPPVYNLTLLLWQAGERRRAAQHWMRFRKYPHRGASAAVYERLAAQVLPPAAAVPAHESHVSGHVAKESVAALDHMILKYWAELLSEEALERYWRDGGAA